MVVRKLTEMGAEMRVHDPYVEHWYELEKQDAYPAPGHSLGALLPQPGRPDRHPRAAGPGRGARRAPRP